MRSSGVSGCVSGNVRIALLVRGEHLLNMLSSFERELLGHRVYRESCSHRSPETSVDIPCIDGHGACSVWFVVNLWYNYCRFDLPRFCLKLPLLV